MIQLILIQVITFAVIIGVLHLLFGSQLKLALNRLQALHQESLEKEEVLDKEMERAKIQAQSEIARAKEEAKLIVDGARRNAEKIAVEATESAQIQAKKTIADAMDRTKKLEADILSAAEEKSVMLAQELITFTFSSKGQEILHTQLIDELVENLKAVDKEKLTVKVDHAQVVTPIALTAAEEKKIKEILSEKLGYPITVQQNNDASLIVGMTIKLGGLVIDGSLKNKLTRAMHALRANRSQSL